MADYLADWQAHLQTVALLEATYAPLATLPRHRTIMHLIRALRQYAEGQYRFFYHGFHGDGAILAGNPYPFFDGQPTIYSADHILKTTTERIAADIEAITAAAEQRRNVHQEQGCNPAFLAKADNLAGSALWPDGQPAFRIGDGTDFDGDFRVKTVLTYCLKDDYADTVRVRMVPYAQVALIGMPPETPASRDKLLSIPHEIGHFLFWYSYCETFSEQEQQCGVIDPQTNLFQSAIGGYRNTRERYYDYPLSVPPQSWDEEIFADVYAALIGGPLAALQAQTLAAAKSDAEFPVLLSNDPHPAPILRPLIYLKAMLQFAGVFQTLFSQAEMSNMVDQLLAKWGVHLNARPAHYAYDRGTGVMSDAGGALPNLPMSPLSAPLDPTLRVDASIDKALTAIKKLFAELHVVTPRDWGWSQPTASLQWQTADELDGIKLAMTGHRLNSAPAIREDLDRLDVIPDAPIDVVPPLWDDWAVRAKGYLTHDGNDQLKLIGVDEGDWNNMKAQSLNKWFRVFGSGGWSTEGPCTSRR